jgi:hypothetical protein
MAIMRTNRLTSKTTPPKTITTKGVTVSNTKARKFVPASELAAQDAAFKTSNQNYEAQMKTYKNVPKGEKVYSQFGGGPVDLSPAGLAQYNKMRGADEPEATRVERPKAGGSEADYLKRLEGKGGFVGHVTYKEPTKPTNKKADWSAVQLDKMPTKKATKIETSGTLKGPKERKTATQGWFGDVNPNTAGTSNKQLKQFASYASKTNLGESFIAKPKTAINEYKGEMKSQRKQYIKEGNKAGVKATTADIRQARSAAKFTGSNNPLDVPGMATGYRAAQDNAANRNTIKAQVSSLKKLR